MKYLLLIFLFASCAKSVISEPEYELRAENMRHLVGIYHVKGGWVYPCKDYLLKDHGACIPMMMIMVRGSSFFAKQEILVTELESWQKLFEDKLKVYYPAE